MKPLPPLNENFLSTIMTYAKTPSGKTSKGEIGIQVVKGRIKVNFPRQYFAGEQVKKGLMLSDTPDGHAKAKLVVKDLQHELEKGKLAITLEDGTEAFNEQRFQEILHEHGITANLKIVKFPTSGGDQVPPKPELSVLEVWDIYCEYKKNKLQETTYHLKFRKSFLNPITKTVAAVGEDALKMHNWLLENYSAALVKNVLSHLDNAYQLCMKQKLLSHNPFDGLADDIDVKPKGKDHNDENTEEDNSILDKTKAFTWNEAETIMEYVKAHPRISHWYPYIAFKFFTGCRNGEASGLRWCDIFWDNEKIVIRRSYCFRIKRFKSTKNGEPRTFPMPKNGELWNLLKSLPQGDPNECIFKTQTGKMINNRAFSDLWLGDGTERRKGIIPTLIKQGKLSKYLPPYNTRHTFINHQINDIGIAPHVVNAWCSHSDDTSKAHYRDLDLRIIPGYGNEEQEPIKTVVNEVDSLKEIIKSMQEQMKTQSELIASLQAQLNQQK